MREVESPPATSGQVTSGVLDFTVGALFGVALGGSIEDDRSTPSWPKSLGTLSLRKSKGSMGHVIKYFKSFVQRETRPM